MYEVVAQRRRAILIDDAYGRPSPSDLQSSLQTLRRFLNKTPAAKEWFDSSFGLKGSPQNRAYFDPLLKSPDKVMELWQRRSECPAAEQLVTEGFPELVSEIEPLQQPLLNIESVLTARQWELLRFPALPDSDTLEVDVELIVLDYVLTNVTPADITAKIQESTQFLKRVLERIGSQADRNMPLVLLVSSQPSVANEAEQFRTSVGIQGAYFHFIKKSLIQEKLVHRLESFDGELPELEAYRRAHTSLRQALTESFLSLQSSVDRLELQDLAALHVGHLLHEGESLSDYVAWMFGQVLTAKLQKSVELATTSDGLPQQNYRLLLGHLKPTQGIPKLFCELSSVKPASGELKKAKSKIRDLRFGDLFVAKIGRKVDVSRFFLVVSQTCDLLQCKITNGKVMCVEGSATLVNDNEASMVRATLRQLDEKGSTLISHDAKYYQITWREADLCSIDQKALQSEKGYAYFGRLNEIYALEVQHTAINNLGRVGVPVKPGYCTVYGAFRLRIWQGKTEVTSLASDFNTGTVVAVLRPVKKDQIFVLLSGELRSWLEATLKTIQVNKTQGQSKLPDVLVDTVRELLEHIAGSEDIYFVCKKTKSGQLQLLRGQMEKQVSVIQKVSVVFDGASVFEEVASPEGVRVQFEFSAIT